MQILGEDIAAKEKADPEYVLRGGWVEDVPKSEQYLNITTEQMQGMCNIF